VPVDRLEKFSQSWDALGDGLQVNRYPSVVRQLTLSRSIDVSALRTMLGIVTFLRLDFAPLPRSFSSHDEIG
jgi:hypothetical protein